MKNKKGKKTLPRYEAQQMKKKQQGIKRTRKKKLKQVEERSWKEDSRGKSNFSFHIQFL